MLFRSVFAVIARANKYIDETSPWVLAKSEETMPKLAAVLYNLAETLRVCTVLLLPFMPDVCGKIFLQLGTESELCTWDSAVYGVMKNNVTLHKGENIFPRIDAAKELAELEEIENKQKAEAMAAAGVTVKEEKKEEKTVEITEIGRASCRERV